ncbi:MAG: choice-of-anchor tandem repeat GloVer-containing protein, partial [Capsulimonadaceae bacterium]
MTNDGANPTAGLIQGSDGNFYGTTSYGGSTVNSGVAFKMSPSGAMTILHSFGDGSVANDGAIPAGLIQGSDGNYYGTTSGGGSADVGTVFVMSPSGTVTILHSFGDGTVSNDGAIPEAGLIQGSDGNFYGTTWFGGSSAYGVAFRMAPSGAMTILHSFGDGSVSNDGGSPRAGLIQGSDGNFYGTTLAGGSAGWGTAFKMTPSGAVTILHSFLDGSVPNDGQDPNAGLIQGSDSNFYGTTSEGGSADAGTVFKMTPSGAVTILHSFGDGSVPNDGQSPLAGLIQGSDGNFYGTTVGGGPAGWGTAFKMT